MNEFESQVKPLMADVPSIQRTVRPVVGWNGNPGSAYCGGANG